MNDAIKAAILAGEAELAKKKAAELEEARERAAKEARWAEEARAEARKWVAEVLPGKIMALTAQGVRHLSVDEYQYRACKEIGMTVSSEYGEPEYDEGCQVSGGWYYVVSW
jgi:hypothetical protein